MAKAKSKTAKTATAEKAPQVSFDPWLNRVRLARTWLAICLFVAITTISRTRGVAWDDAILRGLLACLASYFVGWASALWVCGELYRAQVNRIVEDHREREREKARVTRELYEQRAAAQQEGHAPRQHVTEHAA